MKRIGCMLMVLLMMISAGGLAAEGDPLLSVDDLLSLEKSYTVLLDELEELIVAHDLKEYGDTDEEVHRFLFENGCFRMELNLKDKTGKVSKKVYYLNSKECFPESSNSVGNILIGYAEYLKFLK